MCLFALKTIVRSAGAVEADRYLARYKCGSSSEPFGVVVVGGEAVIKDVDKRVRGALVRFRSPKASTAPRDWVISGFR